MYLLNWFWAPCVSKHQLPVAIRQAPCQLYRERRRRQSPGKKAMCERFKGDRTARRGPLWVVCFMCWRRMIRNSKTVGVASESRASRRLAPRRAPSSHLARSAGRSDRGPCSAAVVAREHRLLPLLAIQLIAPRPCLSIDLKRRLRSVH